jgi:hypothetical protein
VPERERILGLHLERKLVLIIVVVATSMAIGFGLAGLTNTLTWNKSFEVRPPKVDCDIVIVEPLILNYPIGINVSLRIGGTSDKAIFNDDFETSQAGTFPPQWTLAFDGKGYNYQIVVDNASSSPTRSLQMVGDKYWAADAVKYFQSDADKIGFEVSVMVSMNSGKPEDDVKVGLWKRIDWGNALWTEGVAFTDNGTIVARDFVAKEGQGMVLQSYVPGQWYKIRLELDRKNGVFTVWVDGELKGTDIAASDRPYVFDGFAVSGRYTEIPVYYDDVKIFECALLGLEQNNYAINGTFSVELQQWNVTSEVWDHVIFLQERTNITLTSQEFKREYMYVPTSVGKYNVKVTLETDFETSVFTEQP